MKLSKETLTILKNFSTIDSCIVIEPGSTLVTTDPGKSIQAVASISESFEHQVCIYDLSTFLGAINLFDDPEFEFEKNRVVLSGNGRTLTYYYANPDSLPKLPERYKPESPDVRFFLSNEHLSNVLKASAALSLPHLSMTNRDGKVFLVAFDADTQVSNTYEVEVGEYEGKDTFDFHININYLKLIPGNYDVNLSKGRIASFERQGCDLVYHVAMNLSSTYNGVLLDD